MIDCAAGFDGGSPQSRHNPALRRRALSSNLPLNSIQHCREFGWNGPPPVGRRHEKGGWYMKGSRMQRPSRFGLALGAVLAALSFPAAAQEVVLKGVAAFQEGSIYAQKFEQYIKAVNEKGKGQIRIQYLGGAPKVMPLFDVGKNLKDGVIDIVTTSSAYYGNVLPEAEAMKLIEVSMGSTSSTSCTSTRPTPSSWPASTTTSGRTSSSTRRSPSPTSRA
jgi:hypothetical protein